MKCRLFVAILILVGAGPGALAQSVESDIKKGNDLYREKQYQPAANAYDEALARDPASRIAKFNRASVTYRLSKYSEAIKSFEDIAKEESTAENKSRAFYNKGAILSSQKRLEESIDAYKNALRQNPNDKDARENLQKALLELKKKTPPKKEKDKSRQKEQQQNKKQQPRMNPRDAEQKLKLLEQKEKALQQRMQNQKATNTSGGGRKDW